MERGRGRGGRKAWWIRMYGYRSGVRRRVETMGDVVAGRRTDDLRRGRAWAVGGIAVRRGDEVHATGWNEGGDIWRKTGARREVWRMCDEERMKKWLDCIESLGGEGHRSLATL